ncbi:hypothetical protein SAMD00019534_071760 [Acytostelium subglobosum LB1]|uniref:hypothetical protein n=1 Tax=Acytostelium subglobosum LB1 TaxID=1410327 RepID=UPI000644ECED|nr:hypothetical protein SAMD00019534_071760 [Acytostelium subglobosum LB1]GAM24001.1 hypothetical protein SAMD00019534_071760 [Acytostelium subglobosum LB1]|eukprot:XP_012753037.1 hypothetical protein SAMD00019534_071760 [Acytostelium subglobosum LB1]
MSLATVSKQFYKAVSLALSNNFFTKLNIRSMINIGSKYCLFNKPPRHMDARHLRFIPEEHKTDCKQNLQLLIIPFKAQAPLSSSPGKIQLYHVDEPHLIHIKFVELDHYLNPVDAIMMNLVDFDNITQVSQCLCRLYTSPDIKTIEFHSFDVWHSPQHLSRTNSNSAVQVSTILRRSYLSNLEGKSQEHCEQMLSDVTHLSMKGREDQARLQRLYRQAKNLHTLHLSSFCLSRSLELLPTVACTNINTLHTSFGYSMDELIYVDASGKLQVQMDQFVAHLNQSIFNNITHIISNDLMFHLK